jgi:hypothetical protein
LRVFNGFEDREIELCGHSGPLCGLFVSL